VIPQEFVPDPIEFAYFSLLYALIGFTEFEAEVQKKNTSDRGAAFQAFRFKIWRNQWDLFAFRG
jgi:hypothetical protein